MAATLKDIEHMVRKATRPVPAKPKNVALSLDYLHRYRPAELDDPRDARKEPDDGDTYA